MNTNSDEWIADIASYDDAGAEAIAAACKAGQLLPSDGWLQRLAENSPFGPLEALKRGQEVTNDHINKAYEHVLYLHRLARRAPK